MSARQPQSSTFGKIFADVQMPFEPNVVLKAGGTWVDEKGGGHYMIMASLARVQGIREQADRRSWKDGNCHLNIQVDEMSWARERK